MTSPPFEATGQPTGGAPRVLRGSDFSANQDSGRFLGSWVTYPLIALIVLISAWLHSELYIYAFDDAYIHFRIAEHLLENGAPYYNPGQAVMASSSPIWTLILTALFAIASPSPSWVAAINCLVLSAGAVLFGALAYELRGALLGRNVCWLFTLPYLAVVHFSSVGLMETPLAMLALGAALFLHLRSRPEAFALFVAASFLRAELTVFLVIFACEQFWFDRQGAATRMAWASLAALPLVAYDLFFFGTLIPQTVRAKSIVYSISTLQSLELLLLELLGFAPFLKRPFVLAGIVTAFLLFVVSCALAERGLGGIHLRENRVLYLTGAGGAIIALAYVLAKGLVFPWYLPIFMVPVLLTLFVTAAGQRSKARWILLVLLVVAPAALVLSGSFAAASGRHERFRYFEQNARVHQFLLVGERLFDTHPKARLMSSEVGALGYTFGGEIIDAVGLLTPVALRHHPMKVPEQRSAGFIGAIPADLVSEMRPELIVGLDIFVEELTRAPIAGDYHLERQPVAIDESAPAGHSGSLWWSRHLNIFIRRDLCRGLDQPPC